MALTKADAERLIRARAVINVAHEEVLRLGIDLGRTDPIEVLSAETCLELGRAGGLLSRLLDLLDRDVARAEAAAG